MRHATRAKSSLKTASETPAAESFVLSVVGGISRKLLAIHKPPKVRKPAAPAAHADRCALCDAEIDRFDRETFWETGRCQPCDQALNAN